MRPCAWQSALRSVRIVRVVNRATRVAHELEEAEPESSDGIIFPCHSENLLELAVESVCGGKQLFKALLLPGTLAIAARTGRGDSLR